MIRSIILLLVFSLSCVSENAVKRRKFDSLVGDYCLDISRTELKSYTSDSNLYKDIRLSLNRDSTFLFNKSVPFIYDSLGTWETGGNYIEDLNDFFYKSDKLISTQFTILYEDKGDSIFYMNSVTPKRGKDPVHVIFFKKLNVRK